MVSEQRHSVWGWVGCLTVLGEAIRPILPEALCSLVVRVGESEPPDSALPPWNRVVGFPGVEVLSDGGLQGLKSGMSAGRQALSKPFYCLG